MRKGIATDGHLWVALTVSVLMHTLLLTALGLSVGGTRPPLAPAPGLWVQLVDAPRSSAAATEIQARSAPANRGTVAEPRQASARDAAQTQAPESKHTQPDVAPSRSSTISTDQPPRLLDGHVEVTTTSTLARLGEALQGRSLAEFLPEVEKPVRLASALAMDYPPAVLQAQREGSVLAWVRIDESGSVKEVEIVDGEPELADSVREGLDNAHFLPAEAYGHAVENYIVLQFDFRIGSRLAPARGGDRGQRPLP